MNTGMRESAAWPDTDPVRDIARTVLYEGYMLWPYRRSTLKNQRRWTFGAVFPPAWTDRGHTDDPPSMRAECLLEVEGGPPRATPEVDVSLRFLHVVERCVARASAHGMRYVDELVVDGERHVAWQEATEREKRLNAIRLDEVGGRDRAIRVDAGRRSQPLQQTDGTLAGAVVRSWTALNGRLRVWVEPLGGRIVRLCVIASNATPWDGPDRESALRSSFVSTHIALAARGARFVSLTEPPDSLRDAAAACSNQGCWPVLVGERGSGSMMLAAPIILPDYPAVAPESPGDLFDGGEIDELLVLNILGLTDAEQKEMRSAETRTREILERTRSLTREQMLGLHGTFREVRSERPRPGGADGG